MYRLIIGIITYFVAGALIMKLHYKATGTDIIPNKKLWFALPIFIKVRKSSFVISMSMALCIHLCLPTGWVLVHIFSLC